MTQYARWPLQFTGSATPSGPAGGDLSGTYPNPQVEQVHNSSGDVIIDTQGQIYYGNGSVLANSSGDLYYANGNALADISGDLYYNNGYALADIEGNLYYGNGSVLADSSGDLYYNNGNYLVDSSGDLYYHNGNLLVDSSGYLYYNNSNRLADNVGNLYYGNGLELANNSGDLYYNNGSVLADFNGNLYDGNGNLLASNGNVNVFNNLTMTSLTANTVPYLNGSKNLVSSAVTPAQLASVPVVMTSNSTAIVTFNTAGNSETQYDTSGSTITSLTINLPSISNAGQILRYVTAAVATSVTVNGTVSIGAAITNLAANSSVAWQARATVGSGATWIRIQ